MTIPNPLVLSQGDEKIIGAQLRSSVGVIPDVIDVMHIENNSAIKWEFNPDRQNGPFSIKPESFKINVPRNAQIGQYSIPASVNISTPSTFPARFFLADMDNERRQITNFSGLTLTALMARSRPEPANGYATVPANLTLTVTEPLTIEEQIKDFWDVWGSPISLIGGGFAAGLVR